MDPKRNEVEKAFYKLLENGDETAIADALGHSVGYVQQLYDPNNSRESHLWRAIKELRAWRQENMDRGCRALSIFIEFVERGLEPPELCVVAETRKLKQQVDEWENVEMIDHANADTKVQEIRGIHYQAGRALDAHHGQLRKIARAAIDEKRKGTSD